MEHNHPDHSDESVRINRAIGQLEGIKRMIEERRYCPDILVQTRAVTSAVMAVEARILERHIGSCVKAAFNADDGTEAGTKVTELIDIFRGFRRS